MGRSYTKAAGQHRLNQLRKLEEALRLAKRAVGFMCRCEAHQGYTWSSVTNEWSKDIRRRGRKLKKQIEQALKA